jgi:hypothetical protein
LVQHLNPISATEVSRADVLSETFRDSPAVVAEFAAAGVDFVAGSSDMQLDAKALASGEAVWVTYCWDEQRTAEFSI